MTQSYREGDVVLFQAQEWTVQKAPPELRLCNGKGYTWCWYPPAGVTVSGLTLLRRPVRVGDVLRTRGTDGKPCGAEYRVRGFESDRVLYETGYDFINAGLPTRIHADGTPIEPPKAEAVKEPAPGVTKRYGMEQQMMQRADEARSAIASSYQSRGQAQLIDGQQMQAYEQHAISHAAQRMMQRHVPTALEIARGMFMTDPDVDAFVDEHGDTWFTKPLGDGASMSARVQAKVDSAKQTAWERDELGLRTKYLAWAERIRAWLTGATE